MKSIELEHATETLAECALAAISEPIMITFQGQPLVVIQAADESQTETGTVGDDPAFLKIVEESRASYREQGGLTSSQVRKLISALPQ
jgi:hypothetical protein